MKSISKLTLLVSGLASLSAAYGAMESRAVLNIPFEFVANGTRLPAGEYKVTESSGNGLIMLQGDRPGRSVALITIPAGLMSPDGEVGASFERVNGEAHLAALRLSGEPVRVVKLKAAKESAGGAMAGGH